MESQYGRAVYFKIAEKVGGRKEPHSVKFPSQRAAVAERARFNHWRKTLVRDQSKAAGDGDLVSWLAQITVRMEGSTLVFANIETDQVNQAYEASFEGVDTVSSLRTGLPPVQVQSVQRIEPPSRNIDIMGMLGGAPSVEEILAKVKERTGGEGLEAAGDDEGEPEQD